jgi:photosynthetic reaction center cytochrome c subunit
MSIQGPFIVGAAALLTIGMFTLTDWDAPPVETQQTGYRGLGLVQVHNPRTRAEEIADNQAPESPWEADPSGDKARDIYENVQVLGDLSDDEFNHLMAAITEWVSPEQGCAYCHNEENLAEDSVYTKVVSRRMLQMTQHINSQWQDHVQATGVTCYTCHRGQPVPKHLWYEDAEMASGMLGNRAGQNAPATEVALASLPNDPFTSFLINDTKPIRVIGKTALPSGNRSSIKQAEWTYGLMMHMSDALNVNCTYCHNSRSFFAWDQSAPQRTSAWYGIRMAQDLNTNYLLPLGPEYPAHRLGPSGDAPKANCATCHRGLSKPLYGVNMLEDYPSLAAPSGSGN